MLSFFAFDFLSICWSQDLAEPYANSEWQVECKVNLFEVCPRKWHDIKFSFISSHQQLPVGCGTHVEIQAISTRQIYIGTLHCKYSACNKRGIHSKELAYQFFQCCLDSSVSISFQVIAWSIKSHSTLAYLYMYPHK